MPLVNALIQQLHQQFWAKRGDPDDDPGHMSDRGQFAELAQAAAMAALQQGASQDAASQIAGEVVGAAIARCGGGLQEVRLAAIQATEGTGGDRVAQSKVRA